MSVVVISFVTCLLAFTLVGVLSTFSKQNNTEDYLIAGRSVPAWMAALSAVATNNSGFMFVGLIGYTYGSGLEAIWMMVGWIVGDMLAWRLVHPRIRIESERLQVSTVPVLLGRNHNGGEARAVTILAAVLTFIFLAGYAAAQLKAGSLALTTLFGWNPQTGAIIGAMIVVTYCFSGGIRASIWTDVAQSFVMIFAMMLLLISAVTKIGGLSALRQNLVQQDPALWNWLPVDLQFGFAPYLLGMTAGGFGVVGQPHILVRFMAIRTVADIPRARRTYFAWFIPFFCSAILVGLYSRALIPDITAIPLTSGISDSVARELAMPEMARQLLPDVLVGLVLAGLFSATMSTADSQILVCSGAITQDLSPRFRQSYTASKLATLLVTGMSLGMALTASQTVFSLVLIAWSILGAGLGPVLILRLLRQPLNAGGALLLMCSGVSTVILWHWMGYDGSVFKLLPGLVVPFLLYFLLRPILTPSLDTIEIQPDHVSHPANLRRSPSGQPAGNS